MFIAMWWQDGFLQDRVRSKKDRVVPLDYLVFTGSKTTTIKHRISLASSDSTL